VVDFELSRLELFNVIKFKIVSPRSVSKHENEPADSSGGIYFW
jgi:hypothetical protein